MGLHRPVVSGRWLLTHERLSPPPSGRFDIRTGDRIQAASASNPTDLDVLTHRVIATATADADVDAPWSLDGPSEDSDSGPEGWSQ